MMRSLDEAFHIRRDGFVYAGTDIDDSLKEEHRWR